jgi:hypothetical protein
LEIRKFADGETEKSQKYRKKQGRGGNDRRILMRCEGVADEVVIEKVIPRIYILLC